MAHGTYPVARLIRSFCLTALALALPAMAQVPAEIRACVQAASGQVRIVAAGESCRNGERLVIWSVRGPDGPQGPAGPKGDTGATGPVGPSGTFEAGSVHGRVLACDPASVRVHIPGRSFLAIPDAGGSFELSHVPPGQYIVRVDQDGVARASASATVFPSFVSSVGDLVVDNTLTDPANCGACGLSCAAGQACSAGICVGGGPTPPPTCTPTTCAAQGRNCGQIGDGCGGVLQCGSCTSPQTCGGGGTPNMCGTPSCTPTTCAIQGKNCGIISNGCGSLINCGSCAPGKTCSAGNICLSP